MKQKQFALSVESTQEKYTQKQVIRSHLEMNRLCSVEEQNLPFLV